MCAFALTEVKRRSDKIIHLRWTWGLDFHATLFVIGQLRPCGSLPMLPEFFGMKRLVFPVHCHNNTINEICHQNKSQGSPKFIPIPNEGLVIRTLLHTHDTCFDNIYRVHIPLCCQMQIVHSWNWIMYTCVSKWIYCLLISYFCFVFL